MSDPAQQEAQELYNDLEKHDAPSPMMYISRENLESIQNTHLTIGVVFGFVFAFVAMVILKRRKASR